MSYGFSRGKAPTEQTAIAYVQAPAEEKRAETRSEVRGKGFTGNQCSTCGSIHMVIAGHCEVCTDCGSSSGCS